MHTRTLATVLLTVWSGLVIACDTGEAALKSWTFKTGVLGSGATVWRSAQTEPQLARPAADTVESRLVAKLCTGPVSLR